MSGDEWDDDAHVAPVFPRRPDVRGVHRRSDDGPADDPDQERKEALIEQGRMRKPWGWA